jgi:hypothetical protein
MIPKHRIELIKLALLIVFAVAVVFLVDPGAIESPYNEF